MTTTFPKRRGGYYYHNGKAYLSVTTALKSVAKPALRNWYARRACSLIFSDPERYSDERSVLNGIFAKSERAMTRGSDVHAVAEGIAKSGIIPEGTTGYEAAIASFFQTMKPEVLYSEVNVYSDTYGYAGTADLIAKMQDDKMWIIDFKTGKAVYPEAALQLAAYQNADFLLDGDEKQRTKGNYGFPPIDAAAVVLLKEDGTFTFTPVDTNNLLDVFLAAKRIWEWMN